MSKGWGLVGDVGRLEVTSLGCNATRPEWTLSDALARWRMQWIPISVTVTVRVEETDSGLGHEYILEHELACEVGYELGLH